MPHNVLSSNSFSTAGGPPHSVFAGQGHHSLPAVLDLGRRKSPSPQGMLDRALRVSFRNEAVPQDPTILRSPSSMPVNGEKPIETQVEPLAAIP